MKTSLMRRQRQIISIRENSMKIEFTDADENVVKQWAKDNRTRLKREGALKVVHNYCYVEV